MANKNHFPFSDLEGFFDDSICASILLLSNS